MVFSVVGGHRMALEAPEGVRNTPVPEKQLDASVPNQGYSVFTAFLCINTH